MSSIEPVAQPRIDTLVKDSALNVERRRVEYSGTIWLGGRPQFSSGIVISSGSQVHDVPPFFLPDSMPYKRDALGNATIAGTVAAQSAPDDVEIGEAQFSFADDPSLPNRAWVQLALTMSGRGPIGISYRVVTLTLRTAIEG